jgi:hypothetical protein
MKDIGGEERQEGYRRRARTGGIFRKGRRGIEGILTKSR